MGAGRIGESRQPATTSERGLLGTPTDGFTLDRLAASTDLAGLVERHWLVRWDLPAGTHSSVSLLPHPTVNLVVDRGRAMVAGVGLARFTYPLAGRGWVFGVKLRPGGLLPLLAGAARREGTAGFTGRSEPLSVLWGHAAAGAFAADIDAASKLVTPASLPVLAEAAERHLRAHRPAPDPMVARVGEIVRALLTDRSVTRVEDAARRFGLSTRSLQRLFQRYVGVSPKWVLRRYRLHEAAARLAEGTDGSWAEVAADLGYFDQSHFIRDFADAVGMTPAAYAQSRRSALVPVSV